MTVYFVQVYFFNVYFSPALLIYFSGRGITRVGDVSKEEKWHSWEKEMASPQALSSITTQSAIVHCDTSIVIMVAGEWSPRKDPMAKFWTNIYVLSFPCNAVTIFFPIHPLLNVSWYWKSPATTKNNSGKGSELICLGKRGRFFKVFNKTPANKG